MAGDKPSMAIRIAANLDELRKNLAEGRAQIETTTAAMSKIAASLQGDKLIQQAHNVTAAVAEIGGASKLTEAEMARVHATVTKALAKYEALGKEAPAAMRTLAAETAKHPSLLDKITGALGPLGVAMAAAFSFTAIVAAGKKVLDFADHITNLSQKLGMSTDWVQKFELAFAPVGISVDTVSTASLKLSKNLIDGDKSTLGALLKLGVSVADLKKMAPEQLFLTVADAVGKVPNQTEKAFAAMTVFGKGGGELLAGLTGHLRETTDGFEAMGLIIDSKTIKAADDFGDQLGLMGKQLLAIVATVLGPLLPALSLLGNALTWLGSNVIGPLVKTDIKILITALGVLWAGIATLLSHLADLAQKVPLVGKHLGGLADASDWLKKSAASTSAHVVGLWTETDKVGASAATAAPKLLGLGGANDKAAKSVKTLAEQLKELRERYALNNVEGEAFRVKTLAIGEALALVGEKMPIPSMKDLAEFSLRAATDVDGLRGSIEELERGGRFGSAALVSLNTQIMRLPNVTPGATAALRDAMRAERETTSATQTLSSVLGSLSQDFAQLSQIGGESFGPFMQQAGITIKAVEQIIRGAEELSKALKTVGDDAAGAGSKTNAQIGGTASLVLGIFLFVKELGDAIDAADKKASDLAHSLQFAADVQKDFGTLRPFSPQLTQSLMVKPVIDRATMTLFASEFDPTKRNGNTSDLSRRIAEALQLTEIISELGGAEALTAQGLLGVTARFNDLLVLVKATGPDGAAAIKSMDDALRLFGASTMTIGSEASEIFLDTIAQAHALGIELSVVTDLATTFGLTWRDLTDAGAQFDHIAEAAGKLYTNIEALIVAGYEESAVIRGNSKDINQFLVDALAAGAGIPPGLQPIIEQLITMGGLTNEAARAMLGLGADTMPTLADISAAAERYGLKLDALGPKVKQLQINDTAKQVVADFELLKLAGADTGTVIAAMGPKIQGMASDALRAGLTIPEGLKPILQGMIDTGTLVDDNGQKLRDLSKFNFAEPLEKMVSALIAKLDELIVKFAEVAGVKLPPLMIHTQVVPDYAGPQASGGDYLVTKPTLFLAGEAGPERATFGGANRASAAIGPGGSGGSVHVEMAFGPVYVTSDDARDPDRLAMNLQRILQNDTRGTRTLLETVARKAVA